MYDSTANLVGVTFPFDHEEHWTQGRGTEEDTGILLVDPAAVVRSPRLQALAMTMARGKMVGRLQLPHATEDAEVHFSAPSAMCVRVVTWSTHAAVNARGGFVARALERIGARVRTGEYLPGLSRAARFELVPALLELGRGLIEIEAFLGVPGGARALRHSLREFLGMVTIANEVDDVLKAEWNETWLRTRPKDMIADMRGTFAALSGKPCSMSQAPISDRS